MRPTWRPLLNSDLDDVARLAAKIHPSFPEDDAVFGERLDLYPAGCWLLCREHLAVGYAFSHPWVNASPPALNTLLGALPDMPGCLYLHDIAIEPEARGNGAASQLVRTLLMIAGQRGLPYFSLTAVNNSEQYWKNFGFSSIDEPHIQTKLKSYGLNANYMQRKI